MNQQEATVDGALSEEEIADYLRAHPDFFERHDQLLLRLKLPHSRSGATVSLVERQVAVLRQRNDQLERKLKGLVEIAKQNDVVVGKIHVLALKLLGARSVAETLDTVETHLREDFAAERAVIVLFSDAPPAAAVKGTFAKVFARDDAELRPFSAFIKAGRTRCGRLRERQKEVLFGQDDEAAGSAAMLPLGSGGKLGFLVINNSDEGYFNPAKSTDFLDRLGELIGVALEQALAG